MRRTLAFALLAGLAAAAPLPALAAGEVVTLRSAGPNSPLSSVSCQTTPTKETMAQCRERAIARLRTPEAGTAQLFRDCTPIFADGIAVYRGDDVAGYRLHALTCRLAD
ncbi:MAG: hypothetical protein IT557_06940 [Alphaproteobacteria bacterium]|nr:hypothetical protein [Alphaproteobacteria bacterium]